MAERSPMTILANRPWTGPTLSPTRGTRDRIHADQEVDPNSDPEARWAFAKTLYQTKVAVGKFVPPKSVWLFVLVDRNWRIRDQMVVKCTETSDEHNAKAVFQETKYNSIIGKLKCEHMVRHRGFRRRRYDLHMRIPAHGEFAGIDDIYQTNLAFIYSDFCPHGDLHDLVDAYSLSESREIITEHYIWYTLGQIVAAFSALQNGRCDSATPDSGPTNDGDNDVTPWKPLVHCDVKPLNIFLGDFDDRYQSYARPLLADFDSVVEEGSKEWASGTVGFVPPVRHQFLVHLLILRQ